MLTAHPVPALYRQSVFGPIEPLFKRALIIASSLGLVALLVIFLAPAPTVEESTVEELPERLARLILEEAKPVPPPVAIADAMPRAEAPEPEVAEPEKIETPTPKPIPQPRRTPRAEKPKVAQDRGQQGRAKAQAEVTQQLASVTSSVEKTLEGLSSSLPTATSRDDGEATKPRRRGGRKVRGARGANDIARSGARETSGGSKVGGTAIDAGPVEIGAIEGLTLTDASGTPIAPSGGSGGGSTARSQGSLLAVVKRYSPGIRYCYDTALKTDPALQGKLVFRLTISAAGKVTDVAVVENTLRSNAVVECAKAQILSWKFPAASEAVSFQTPFVFRPPK